MASPTSDARASRSRKPSAAQKQINQTRVEAAAKTRANKEKAKRAAARKEKRRSNDAQAAILRDTTNTVVEREPLAPSAEEQIARLTARLQSAEAHNETLARKNKRLKKSMRRHPASTTDSSPEIIPIPKPKGKFNLQEAMELTDKRALYTELQSGIHAIALEAKLDFGLNWSQQDPGLVAKILRVAEEHHPYLGSKRFPRHWATSSILQRYLNSVRAYQSGKANPSSGVSRRRERVTRIGQREAEAQRRRKHSRRVITSPSPDEDDSMDVEQHGETPANASDSSQEGSRSASPLVDEHVPRVPRDDSDDDDLSPGVPDIQPGDDDDTSDDEDLPLAED
ncbi:hypothetical protein B0H15DRAFT_796477 [Mycena belliarum]|uniref:Uncharacterized protein n=1 Tax=Mycena belliarum TaxID=1033014 RepID=A0AAD6UFM5_9AGAR|nr:hypothetical protein B0H15DRAFT_796477 [Mycena belliae]